MKNIKTRFELLDADGDRLRWIGEQEATRLIDFGYASTVEGRQYQIRIRVGGTRKGALTADDTRAGAGLYGQCPTWQRTRIDLSR